MNHVTPVPQAVRIGGQSHRGTSPNTVQLRRDTASLVDTVGLLRQAMRGNVSLQALVNVAICSSGACPPTGPLVAPQSQLKHERTAKRVIPPLLHKTPAHGIV